MDVCEQKIISILGQNGLEEIMIGLESIIRLWYINSLIRIWKLSFYLLKFDYNYLLDNNGSRQMG